jgi:hypothetical protein
MTRSQALALALLLLVASGCRQDGAREAVAAGAVVPDAAAHALPSGRMSPSPSLDPEFDPTALAGSFHAEGTTVQIRADGRYHLRARAAGAGADQESEGLWSLEIGSGQLLLVPHAVDEPRRRYSMPTPDELAPEGGGLSLRRVGLGAPRN